jgi:hypothetical protein
MQGYVAVELGLDGMEFHMNNEEVSIFSLYLKMKQSP